MGVTLDKHLDIGPYDDVGRIEVTAEEYVRLIHGETIRGRVVLDDGPFLIVDDPTAVKAVEGKDSLG